MKSSWKAIIPLAFAVALALIPAPDGLPQHARYYFAICAGVIVGLMLEPLPGAAIGVIGVTLASVLCTCVLFAPDQLAKPGFKAPAEALKWALSGFSNGTEWFVAVAPAGILLLLAVPLLAYLIYPPEVKEGHEVPRWAAAELDKMGGLTRREVTLSVLLLLALGVPWTAIR